MKLRIFKEVNDDLLEVLSVLEKGIFEAQSFREKFVRKISNPS